MLRSVFIAACATFFGSATSILGLNPFDPPDALASSAAEPLSSAAGQKGAPHGGLRIDRAADGLFHAPVLINGRPISLVVDTGATVTVLTAADAARLGVRPGATPRVTIRTAGGEAPMAWATARSLRIGTRDLAAIDVAVVARGLDHSLLGQDVLSAGGILRVERDVMEIS